LPNDEELVADLSGFRSELDAGGRIALVQDDVRQRVGWTPDRADAVAPAWVWLGAFNANRVN